MSEETSHSREKAKAKLTRVVLSVWLREECGSLWFPPELAKRVRDFAAVYMDSNILTLTEMSDLCERAFEKCDVELSDCRLLFRGSKHGFRASKFHEMCDGKGATLTLVQTEFGQVIGGFTTVPWTTSNSYKQDTGAWLFVSRVNESKKPQYSGVTLPAILKANSGSTKQIYHASGYGVTFGNGCDLYIANGCDVNQNSYCRCTGAYAFSNVCDGVTLSVLAITGGSTLTSTYSEFRVVDYEVFSAV